MPRATFAAGIACWLCPLALPSGRSSRIEHIATFNGDLREAGSPLSVTLTLAEEIDLSRGDMLAAPDARATVTSDFTASPVWMNAVPLAPRERYLLKHGSRTVGAQVTELLQTIDLRAQAPAILPGEFPGLAPSSLGMNDIGVARLETLLRCGGSLCQEPRTGSFVVIDPQSNATVAAGMIRECESRAAELADGARARRVTDAERMARFDHAGTHLHLTAQADFAN